MTFLCMIAHRNKAVTKQHTGTTQQQNDQTSHCGSHVLTEGTREWGILVLVKEIIFYLVSKKIVLKPGEVGTSPQQPFHDP